MTVISTTNQNIIKDASTHLLGPVLNAVPLDLIAAFQLTADATYPVTQLSVTLLEGSTSNIKINQMWKLEGDDGVKAYGVIRKAYATDTIYIDVKSEGDAGYSTRIEEDFVTGDTLTIYSFIPPWALWSRVASTTQYKKWDVAYTDEGSNPAPVVNLTEWQSKFSNGSTAEFTVSMSESFAWSGTITAISWTLPTGYSITSGSLISNSVTFTLPEGFHIVECELTTSTGATGIGYTYIWCNSSDPSDVNAPFSWKYPIKEMQGDKSDPSGRELSMKFVNAAVAEIYPGMGILFNDNPFFGTSQLSGVTEETFIGYLDEVESEFFELAKGGDLSLNFKSPLKIIQKLPSATQYLEEVLSPNAWTEVGSSFSHPAFVVHYLMVHHCTVLSLHSFVYDSNIATLRRKIYGISQENIGGQLKFIGDLSLSIVTCSSNGTIRMIEDPNHMENTERNTLDSKFTWEPTEIKGSLRIIPKIRADIASLVGNALSYNGSTLTPVRALAPGFALSQGITKSSMVDFVVAAGLEQDKLNKVVGHRLAYINNPLSNVEMNVLRNIDVADPAMNDWHIIKIPTTYIKFTPDTFILDWDVTTGMRATPERVTRKWKKNNRGVWTKDIVIVWRFESFGKPGVYLPIDQDGAWDFMFDNGWLFDVLDPYLPEIPSLTFTSSRTLFIDSLYALSKSDDITVQDPSWFDAESSMNGVPVHVEIDRSSPLIQSTGTELYAEVLTWDDATDTAYIYRGDINVDGIPSWTQQTSQVISNVLYGDFAGPTASDVYGSSLIFTMRFERCVVVRKYSGTYYWDFLQNNDSSTARIEPFGCSVFDTRFAVSTYRSSGIVGYRLYYATGGGSWSIVAGHPGINFVAEKPHSYIKLVSDTAMVFPAEIITVNEVDPNVQNFSQYDALTNDTDPNDSVTAGGSSTYYTINRRYYPPSPYDTEDMSFDSINVEVDMQAWYRYAESTGSPDYDPTATELDVQIEAYIHLLDNADAIIWQSSTITASMVSPWDDAAYGDEVSFVDFAAVDGQRRTVSITFDETFGSTLTGVHKILVYVRTVSAYTISQTVNVNGTDRTRFKIEIASLPTYDFPIAEEREVNLYKVTSLDSSPSFSDVTPSAREPIQKYHRELAIDRSNGDLAVILKSSSGAYYIYKSTDDGTSWTLVNEISQADWMYFSGSTYILIGNARIDISLDSGLSIYNRIGTYESDIQAPGIFREGIIVL